MFNLRLPPFLLEDALAGNFECFTDCFDDFGLFTDCFDERFNDFFVDRFFSDRFDDRFIERFDERFADCFVLLFASDNDELNDVLPFLLEVELNDVFRFDADINEVLLFE